MDEFKNVKKQFPIFSNFPGLIYLDSTATSLKPWSVIDELSKYYSNYSANIYRGVYRISEKATEEFEKTRQIVAQFLKAKTSDEIVFTRNTTESLNLVAYTLGRQIVGEGDEIVTTVMEHHSNFVPWQQLAFENGAVFKVIDVDDRGYLACHFDGTTIPNIISKRTKVLALTYVSNVLGTINPVKQIILQARKINPDIIVVVDAAQAVPHLDVNVAELGCDFLAFSSHKMLGPTGVGVLWGRLNLLEKMFPFMFGGEMIVDVSIAKTTFKRPPHKFEAGTPAIGEIIAFKEAIKFLQAIGLEKIRHHEKILALRCFDTLKKEFGEKIKLYGPNNFDDRGGVVAFNFGDYHSHDVASILDEENIAVRAGHHCAMPLHKRLDANSSVRASFYIYNNENDIDLLVKGLRKVEKILKNK